jgi:hypothetical protein
VARRLHELREPLVRYGMGVDPEGARPDLSSRTFPVEGQQPFVGAHDEAPAVQSLEAIGRRPGAAMG